MQSISDPDAAKEMLPTEGRSGGRARTFGSQVRAVRRVGRAANAVIVTQGSHLLMAIEECPSSQSLDRNHNLNWRS